MKNINFVLNEKTTKFLPMYTIWCWVLKLQIYSFSCVTKSSTSDTKSPTLYTHTHIQASQSTAYQTIFLLSKKEFGCIHIQVVGIGVSCHNNKAPCITKTLFSRNFEFWVRQNCYYVFTCFCFINMLHLLMKIV